MRLAILIISILFVQGIAVAQIDTTQCPPIVFNTETLFWCPTGEVTIGVDYCSPFSFWSLDSVQWSMDDGGSHTTVGSTAVEHTYQTGDTVQVTAIAFFTNTYGETCSTLVYDYPDAGSATSTCDFFQDSISSYPFESYLELVPEIANPNIYFSSTDYCSYDTVKVFNSGILQPVPGSYSGWSYTLYLDGQTVATGSGIPDDSSPIYQDAIYAGDYTFEIEYTYSLGETYCTTSNVALVQVEDCDTCANCNSFRPLVGQRYWLSAWVKENQSDPVKNYESALIRLDFTGAGTEVQFQASGELIEGWQRIVGSFTIPSGTTDLDIELINNDASADIYFDDVRIHPFNASMKSYVYDPETLWLTAELDDNNYATFYEYDLEGQLIRIKKETARGIMTIQESRSSNPKE